MQMLLFLPKSIIFYPKILFFYKLICNDWWLQQPLHHFVAYFWRQNAWLGCGECMLININIILWCSAFWQVLVPLSWPSAFKLTKPHFSSLHFITAYFSVSNWLHIGIFLLPIALMLSIGLDPRWLQWDVYTLCALFLHARVIDSAVNPRTFGIITMYNLYVVVNCLL